VSMSVSVNAALPHYQASEETEIKQTLQRL